MTLIGIAGCTALLLVGFGLHDSISDIMDMQFDKIAFDNFRVAYKDGASEQDKSQVLNVISNERSDSQTTLTYEENMVCMPQGHPNASTTIVVPAEPSVFEEMRIFRNRQTKQILRLDDSGVFVSEKLASMMGLSVGDTITVYNQDMIGNAGDDEYQLTISGVVENYIAHYIYMTPKFYRDNFSKDCKFNNHVARIDGADADFQQNIVNSVKDVGGVKTAYFITATRDSYEQMLKSVNMVVVVLIVSAGLLAFVVLYNLININICERAREIATLKVLGSNSREINMYIHRETFMLSIMGSILGILLGFVMEQFVIVSAEVDYVMFGRNIY